MIPKYFNARKLTFLFVTFAVISSCSEPIPAEVENLLTLSGDNKSELLKPIQYFKKQKDSDKLKAYYYMLQNLEDKYSLQGDEIDNYDAIFKVFGKYIQKKKFVYKSSPVIKAKWDSLVNKYGTPTADELNIVKDYQVLKGDDLIKNINYAFKSYKTRWSKNLSFEEFCEYLLPYKLLNEKPEPWQQQTYLMHKPIFDKYKNLNTLNLVDSANSALEKIYDTNHILWEYPFDMSFSNMILAKRGTCKQIVAQTARIFRANGVPVGIDYTPQWGDRPNSHFWNTVVLENGKNVSFDAVTVPFGGVERFHYRLAKVFRMTFKRQTLLLPRDTNEVPAALLDDRRKDVTKTYVKAYSFKIPVTNPINNTHKFTSAVICSYAKAGWRAQDWGEVSGNNASFKDIGSNLAYIVMFYLNDEYIPASDPFILSKNGSIHFLSPKKTATLDMKVTRKNPSWPVNKKNMETSIGAKFQVSNKADFSDAITLDSIVNMPSKFEEIKFKLSKKFRYVRMIGPMKKNAVIAELEFFTKNEVGLESKLEGRVIGYPEVTKDAGSPYSNAFDNDPATFFMGGKKTFGWAGLSLKEPSVITKVRYAPRSDTNFILVGDLYELFIWKYGSWMSLGKQKAPNQFLIFKKVPSNGLYLLHNHTRGNEERIFTYEHDEQIWW